MTSPAPALPRLTYLRIKNYRALRDVEFRDLTPLTVLIGPNGSGKSTVLDALDFLAEAVRGNLVNAWEKRDRFEGMRTRGSEENIEFEMEALGIVPNGNINYLLEIAQHEDGRLFIMDEKLRVKYSNGVQTVFFQELRGNAKAFGAVVKIFKGEFDSESSINFTNDTEWSSTTLLTDYHEAWQQSLISQYHLFRHPSNLITSGLLELLTSYRRIHLTDEHLAGFSTKGPRERLSANGDNLPNVLYYLHTKHPEALAKITAQLRRWVPNLADIVPEITSDKRLLLRFRDAPFGEPLPAEYMSGGTMRLAALLTLLYEPDASGLLGIEEPENELHPRLLGDLAEELIAASEQRQLLVTTHSPLLLNALEPEQVWILHRGADGYAQATRVADLPGIAAMVAEGNPLGYLWRSNYFEVDDPLAGSNGSK